MYVYYIDEEKTLENNDRKNELFDWKFTEPDDFRMWCYAGGRRYLFADNIIVVNEGYQSYIYDVDLDTFDSKDHNIDEEDLDYINSCDDDYEKAYAIADCIQPTSETEVFPTEEEAWQYIREYKLK